MHRHRTTTIAAISSPPGPGRRGILRLSGPDARGVVNRAVIDPPEAVPAGSPRGVVEGVLDDGRGRQPVLVFWMPGPRSYTREDVAELHLPGAEPLLARAFLRLLELGAVAAQPGEFTRRAFHHGRLDLTQAEGVLELVQATTEAERRAATQLLSGGLERRVNGLREALADLRALLEASLDFDEADTGHVPGAELAERLERIREALDEALTWEVARQAPATLPRVLLHGAPNAGKSSLFNRLVVGGQALVDELAGTTRDGLAERWRLPGGDVVLLDLPGLDAAARGADATAQRLAEIERASADLVIHVVDATGGRSGAAEAEALPAGVPGVVVWNKTDLAGARAAPPGAIATSATTSRGLAELARAVGRALGRGPGEASGAQARELFARHQRCLEDARAVLGAAREELEAGAPLDLVAEMLRGASAALDGIHGETTPEDVLDRIFARFCLGK